MIDMIMKVKFSTEWKMEKSLQKHGTQPIHTSISHQKVNEVDSGRGNVEDMKYPQAIQYNLYETTTWFLLEDPQTKH